MPSTAKSGFPPMLLVCAALLSGAQGGCASREVFREVRVTPDELRTFLAGKPQALHPHYERLLRQGQRNEVLNRLEIALAALDLGFYDAAEESFDAALARIEVVHADSEQARRVRERIDVSERAKDFKGEPYERAMAYLYRGVLFLASGDYDNAHACFRSGVIQDAFAEEDQNRCDFALLIFLEGWASQCAGDMTLAEAAYKEVKRLRPDFTPPSHLDNVLLLAETGRAPRKVPDGVGHFQLKFFRGREFDERKVKFRVGTEVEFGYPIEDIYWQASTRGGRPIDCIHEGEVKYRRSWEARGTALTEAAATLMMTAPVFRHSGAVSGAAAGLGIAGAIHSAMAQNVRPQADFRYWANLPDAVHVQTRHMKLGHQRQQCVTLFCDHEFNELALQPRVVGIRSRDHRFGIGWARSRSALGELRTALQDTTVLEGR